MKKEIVVSTEDTLGGSPRLDGRRLDIRHVIWGIIEYDNANIKSYQDDFEVTTDQIRHAIMYCKDEICELQNVPQSCNGCSKKFRKDTKTWEEYLQEEGIPEDIQIGNNDFTKLGNSLILLGDLEDYKKEFEGVDTWKTAQVLYLKFKETLCLTKSYEQIISKIQ
ncbi:MAG: hypothetical protein ACI85I_002092 [Arenicella sp.]|jgi:uncharacterized protein (DUF433 family)